MKHLDTSVIWNKLTNIQANLDDKTMYLWCTLYLETSYLQYLNYNHTAKFSWDFSRTWLISESLPGLINGRENGLQWETRWLIQPLELAADRSLLGQLIFQQVLLEPAACSCSMKRVFAELEIEELWENVEQHATKFLNLKLSKDEFHGTKACRRFKEDLLKYELAQKSSVRR